LLHLADNCEQALMGGPKTRSFFQGQQRVALRKRQITGSVQRGGKLQMHLGWVEWL
jgi:hypothetical protein